MLVSTDKNVAADADLAPLVDGTVVALVDVREVRFVKDAGVLYNLRDPFRTVIFRMIDICGCETFIVRRLT